MNKDSHGEAGDHMVVFVYSGDFNADKSQFCIKNIPV